MTNQNHISLVHVYDICNGKVLKTHNKQALLAFTVYYNIFITPKNNKINNFISNLAETNMLHHSGEMRIYMYMHVIAWNVQCTVYTW